MLLKDIIKQLETDGFEIEFRTRSDGGLLITKINGVSFKGAAGNTRAREIAGVQLSQAQISQRSFNVKTFIKGYKHPKDKFDEDLKAKVKKVQYTWRKNKVNGKITMRKAREHFKKEGRKGVIDYLNKMERYGSGYAYYENVRWLSEYAYNVAMGLRLNNQQKAAEEYEKLGDYIIQHADTFREAWIQPVYSYLYEVRDSGYDGQYALNLLPTIYAIMQ